MKSHLALCSALLLFVSCSNGSKFNGQQQQKPADSTQTTSDQTAVSVGTASTPLPPGSTQTTDPASGTSVTIVATPGGGSGGSPVVLTGNDPSGSAASSTVGTNGSTGSVGGSTVAGSSGTTGGTTTLVGTPPTTEVNASASCSSVQTSATSGAQCNGDDVMHGLGLGGQGRYLQCCTIKSSNNILFKRTSCENIEYKYAHRAVCPYNKFITAFHLDQAGNPLTAECCALEVQGYAISTVTAKQASVYRNEALLPCANNEIVYGIGDELAPDRDIDQVFCSTFKVEKK